MQQTTMHNVKHGSEKQRKKMLNQSEFDYIIRMLELGEITSEEANIQMVLAEQAKIVFGKMPCSARNALNNAVKQGRLGHFKKDGLKPEVYYHPDFKRVAISKRNEHEISSISALFKVGA